jgi:hypothetical protein
MAEGILFPGGTRKDKQKTVEKNFPVKQHIHLDTPTRPSSSTGVFGLSDIPATCPGWFWTGTVL